MLRGHYQVKLDDKGRIKVPSEFRRIILERGTSNFYVTSTKGDSARLYPMHEWLAIEEKLMGLGTTDPRSRKFLDRTNFYGQNAEMDSQGRILIHPLLRQSASLTGEVSLIGYLRYIEVIRTEQYKARIENDPYTETDDAAMAALGI